MLSPFGYAQGRLRPRNMRKTGDERRKASENREIGNFGQAQQRLYNCRECLINSPFLCKTKPIEKPPN